MSSERTNSILIEREGGGGDPLVVTCQSGWGHRYTRLSNCPVEGPGLGHRGAESRVCITCMTIRWVIIGQTDPPSSPSDLLSHLFLDLPPQTTLLPLLRPPPSDVHPTLRLPSLTPSDNPLKPLCPEGATSDSPLGLMITSGCTPLPQGPGQPSSQPSSKPSSQPQWKPGALGVQRGATLDPSPLEKRLY